MTDGQRYLATEPPDKNSKDALMPIPQQDATTPVRLEVWERGNGIQASDQWLLKEAYIAGDATSARRSSKELFRAARETFRFPAYLIRDLQTKEPLWLTGEPRNWQPPSWLEISEPLCSAAAHAKIFFRPPLPGVGAVVAPKNSLKPAIVIGTTGDRLEIIHLLPEEGPVVICQPGEVWKNYCYVRDCSLPQPLRFARYPGPELFQEMLASGAFAEIYEQARSSIMLGDILERGRGGFIAPSKMPAAPKKQQFVPQNRRPRGKRRGKPRPPTPQGGPA